MGQSLVTTAYTNTNVTKASDTISPPEKKELNSPQNSNVNVNHTHFNMSAEIPSECPMHKSKPKPEAVTKPKTPPADIPSECPMHQANSKTTSSTPPKRDESDINPTNMVSFLNISYCLV
jgi:hypothetical protein